MARRPSQPPKPPTPAAMRRRLEALTLERRTILAERGLRRLKESLAFDVDWVGPWQAAIQRHQTDPTWFPVGSPSARRYGVNFPFYQNEQQLTLLRDLSRIVAGTSSHAKGLVRGLTAYTIGTGFPFKVSAREDTGDAGKAAAARVTAWLDRWAKRVRWGERQQQAYRRVLRDGEAFVRLFPDGGWLDLRFGWPEQVTQPPGESFEEWGFGVWADPDDAETVVGYYFASLDDPSKGDSVDAADVVHLVDRDTDAGIKRGVPLFSFDAKDQLDTASRLARNVGESTAVRAAHAYIRQHAAAGEQEVQAFADSQADFREPKGFDGYSRRSATDLPPGTVDDIPEGLEYVGPPGDPGTAAQTAVCDFLARIAGTRVNAPPWLVSGNTADMGAYTASLVGESPFVKGILGDQDYYRTRFLGIVTRALDVAAAHGLVERDDLRLVHVDLVPVSPETRDRDKEANRGKTEIDMGVQSPQGYCSEQGRDYDRIQADLKQHQANNPPPQAGPPPGGGPPGGPPLAESEHGCDCDTPRWVRTLTESLDDDAADRVLLEAGYTGRRTDRLGRSRCYDDGRQVPCHQVGDGHAAAAGRAAVKQALADPSKLTRHDLADLAHHLSSLGAEEAAGLHRQYLAAHGKRVKAANVRALLEWAESQAGGGGASARLPGGKAVTFVPHPSQRANPRAYRTVMADPAKLDAAWSQDGGYYIPPGGGGGEIGGRRAGFERFLAAGKPVEASSVTLGEGGRVSFGDGRHRFSVLRDAGADQVAVTVPAAQAEEFGRRFAPAARPAAAEPTHDVKLPRNRKRLNADTARAALRQMGYELGQPTSKLVKGSVVTSYALTRPDGTRTRASGDELKELVYRGAKK